VAGLERSAEDDDEDGAAALSPASRLAHGLEALDLHADEFPDCALDAMGSLCFFGLRRFRQMTEPEGVRSGVRCSFCWRWASKPCTECVSGGVVHVVCDPCSARVGLADVTCLGCLPLCKTAEADACVKTRIAFKDAV
jgi:hypothetical protein